MLRISNVAKPLERKMDKSLQKEKDIIDTRKKELSTKEGKEKVLKSFKTIIDKFYLYQLKPPTDEEGKNISSYKVTAAWFDVLEDLYVEYGMVKIKESVIDYMKTYDGYIFPRVSEVRKHIIEYCGKSYLTKYNEQLAEDELNRKEGEQQEKDEAQWAKEKEFLKDKSYEEKTNMVKTGNRVLNYFMESAWGKND